MAFSVRNLLIVIYMFPLIEFNGNVFCRAQFIVNATQSPTNITMQSGYFFSKKGTKSSVISNQCGFHNFFIPGDGDFPWLALILYKELGSEEYNISCNGNLISSRHILTAGDCVKPNGVQQSIHQVLVIIGNYDVQRWLDGKDSRNYTVKTYDVHPEVATSAFKWELAVITLMEEVQFKTFIRPICLWSGSTNLEEIEGTIGMLSGWRISHGGEILTPKSTETSLSVIPQKKCLRTDFLSGLYSPTRTFCTENKEGSKLCTDNGSSSGILGTGFMIKRNKRWFLRGFFSMGTSFSCELNSHQYLVFIDVSPFSEWILYTMYKSLQVTAANRKETCASIWNSESERVSCKLNDSSISCENPPDNTTAVVVCKPFYVFPGINPVYKCLNGKWDQPFRKCILKCGIKWIAGSTSTTRITVALQNEYPWIVAVYNKDDILVCAGTLISERFVVSGAVCFANSNGVPLPKDDYTIIAGTHGRIINTTDSNSQIRKIKSLHVHENYRGRWQNYRDDIALVELNEKLIVSAAVQPVCIDWDNDLEYVDFVTGKTGDFAGWGYVKAGGPPSEVLKKLTLPFQGQDVCRANLSPDFAQKYYTNDKFCAGYQNKSVGVCYGDSGGGLYFKSDGMHYFLRGILSLSPRKQSGCDMDQFALYTKVSNYLPWIKNITGHQ